MKAFGEIALGERRYLGSHRFSAEEIKRFACSYDPQPFHMDEAAAESSHFGALCASGWHTVATWMKLNVADLNLGDAALKATGQPVARQGPSPGFDALRWLRPVFAGDTISFENEVVSKRASRSRPQWGIVSIQATGRNQHGEDVIAFTVHVFVETLTAGA